MKRKINLTSYFKIFWRAWQITWRNRYLWWFGFFVAFSEISFSLILVNDKENSLPVQQKFIHFISQNTSWAVGIGLLILLVYLLLISLNVIGRGALIGSINKHLQNKPANFKLGIAIGKKYFWRILFLGLTLSLLSFFIIVVMIAPVSFLFFNHNYIIGTLMAILATFILVPVFILFFYLKIFGFLYIVLGDLTFWSAMENAYQLFQKNILSSLGILLLFIPVCLFWLAIIFLVAVPLIIVILAIASLSFLIAGKAGALVIVLIGLAGFLAFIFFTDIIYKTFAQAVWVLFFREIARPKIKEEAIKEIEINPSSKARSLPVIEYKRK